MRRVWLGSCVTWLLSVSVFVPFCSGQQSGSSQARSQSRSGPATRTSKPSEEGSSIAFKDGRLSVDAQGRSVQPLASEITNKTGVLIVLDDAVGTQSVFVSFQELALDEGIRRIFKNNDAFYFYGAYKEEPSALKVVWVYPKGKARGLQPVPPDKWASTKELERLLTDQDPQVRGRAIEDLVERKGQGAQGAVLNSLKDSDAQVRTRALYGATKAGVQVPEGVLDNLLASDPSADVRFLALQALADGTGARAAAEDALNDPSEPVRRAAEEILGRLNPADPAQAASESPQAQPSPNQN